MKRVTIEIDDELDEALAAYARARSMGDDLNAAAEAVLRDHLLNHRYLIPGRGLRLPRRIIPLHRDTGPTDVSINHDKYFADWTLETRHGPTHPPTPGQQHQDW